MTSQCEPGLQKNVTKLPPKTERARTSVGVHHSFLPPSKLFVNFAKVEDVCTCMNFSPCHCTCDWGQKKLVVIDFGWAEEVGCQKSREEKLNACLNCRKGKYDRKVKPKANEKNDRHKASKSIHKHKHER